MSKAKVRVEVDPRIVEESDKQARRSMSPEELIAFAASHWDPDDPGFGIAALDEYGREIFNPVPMAPPIGYKQEVTMMERLQQMLRAERLKAQEEETDGDTLEDMNDFPEDVDMPFYTAYELIMREDWPENPILPEPGEIASKAGTGEPVVKEKEEGESPPPVEKS